MSDSSENPSLPLDATDLRILDQLQRDSSLSNHALAAKVHVSPATCLRRVRRLREEGVIEREVAILSPAHLAAGLGAIVEVTLDQQGCEHQAEFERIAAVEAAVQQCYQVASGPDFVLILQLADMEAYHELAHRLFSGSSNVRNVRTFFTVRRGKFSAALPLPASPL